jgi:peptidoglycan-associated lipoprotein
MHGVHSSVRRLLSAAVVLLAPVTLACAKKRAADAPAPASAVEPVGANAGASTEAMRRDSLAREEEMRMARARRAAEREALTAPIYFGFDESELTTEARRRLDEKLPILQRNTDVWLLVQGHADERGSDEYNIALSQRRAAAAKRYLIYRGIPDARVEIAGFGEERPVCEEPQESCWSRNRRAEFAITRGDLLTAGR